MKGSRKKKLQLLISLLTRFRCVPRQSSRKLLPLAAETASHVHARVAHAQTHTSVGSKTEREAYFSVRNGENGGKKERQKGDYNLIRGRKSRSNPPEGAEMPPCWRLLDFRLTGLHLNGLLWHREKGRQPKRDNILGRENSHYTMVWSHIPI